MTLTWLIDADQDTGRSAEFQAEIRARGYDCRPVKFFPQAKPPGDIVGAEHLPLDARVVYFGGPALMEHIQTHRRWRPGGWCTFNNFNCETYFSYFGKYLLNDDYVLLPAAEALRCSVRVFAQLAVEGEVFIRPVMGRKVFAGACVDSEDFLLTLGRLRDPRTMIVISSPKIVDREWRLFIAHDKVIAASQYATMGQVESRPDCPADILNYASHILRDIIWRPDPLFTMDLCETQGRISIVEINGFSCSNRYSADLNAIIDAVAETAQRS